MRALGVTKAKPLTFLVGIWTVNTEQLLTETVHSYALQNCVVYTHHCTTYIYNQYLLYNSKMC